MLEVRQRRLLGAFIRAHRERARPAAQTGRRRTPGLRREELADLAGISATWCAWIEQGRPVQAAPETLGRIAQALHLTAAERAYLFKLADHIDPDVPRAGVPDVPAALTALVRVLPYPAYGLDRLWNACCWNAAAAKLFVGWLDDDGERERNLLRFVFLSAEAKRLLPNWPARARRLLAEFRADYGRSFRDESVRALLDGLGIESAFFARAWAEQDVVERTGGLRRFNHPQQGALAFVQHSYLPTERTDYKLVALLPARR
jgi:transcriptional regulator with XRE-family HTH domain